MKTKVLSLLSAVFFAGAALAQTSGGPDTYGYTWRNDQDAQGPAVMWNDIKGKGTKIIGLGDDNRKGPFVLGWNFHFYWLDYNKMYVGSNGWIGFTGAPGNIAAPFPTLPSTSAKNTISPLLADLTFTKTNSQPVPNASAWYWSNNVDTFIVQYDSVPYWVNTPNGYDGRYSFQVILSGADSSITFQYNIAQVGTNVYQTTEGTATGISNSSGQIGLQVLPSLTFPTPNSAVKFYYPGTVTYQAFDATPLWNQNPENGGFFLSKSTNNTWLVTDVNNAGNQNITNIPVTGGVYDKGLNQVWSGSATVSSLLIGADSMLAYSTAFTPTTSGTFLYRSTTSLSTDVNPANDITDVEMDIVDTTQATVPLAYFYDTTTTTQISWGGNGGQGIYIQPPFYPASITSVEVYVTNTTKLTTFYHQLQILDDNGPFNSPGTQLYIDSVSSPLSIPLKFHKFALSTPLVVSSGGVYVGYMENGDDSSAIGTSQTLPLSNRNFEIIGGNWAEYRNNATEDFMIRVNIQGNNAAVPEITSDASVAIWPNPFNSFANVRIDFVNPAHGALVFDVYDIYGKQVQSLDLSPFKGAAIDFTLNRGANIAAGLYFYKLKDSEHILSAGKIIVQ
ncbi:MAG: T9SS type A sorting domain-containing protein [Bacteroidetes bacterium]|nr:T9SS type A sorting domain-containing protein [Bacteroidota bacterium]